MNGITTIGSIVLAIVAFVFFLTLLKSDITSKRFRLSTGVRVGGRSEGASENENAIHVCPFKPPTTTAQDNGGWFYTKKLVAREHINFDTGFGEALIDYLGSTTLYDIGAGVGALESFLQERKSSIEVTAFDGGNNIETIWGENWPMINNPTHVVPQQLCWIDAGVPSSLPAKKWVLSVEVGEHIPKSKESVFIDNLVQWATEGIILTWAVPGQGGHQHINEQNNDYIISEMAKRGYVYDQVQSVKFRKSVQNLGYLRKTIMVFLNKNQFWISFHKPNEVWWGKKWGKNFKKLPVPL